MRRDLSALTATEFDLIVAGGGIFGAAAAWEAASRGLSVALLEASDFGHAASANCFKMIHGGIRYLQHGDLVRLRQSTRERSVMLRIAPHLAHPLPILVPTYGHALRGKELLWAGMKIYDLLTADRNRGQQDPERRIPPTRGLSRVETLELFPGLDPRGLTGGMLFHDGQMYSPARLVLAFLHSAAERGARLANHAPVTGLLRERDRVVGVCARDAHTGGELEVRGRLVLNATGGWSERLLQDTLGHSLEPRTTFSRDAYFVVRRDLGTRVCLAVTGATQDPDALVSRSARHLFLVPWRGCTLVGVWHVVWEREPEQAVVGEADLAGWLDEINAAYPGLDLDRSEVSLTHAGLVLFGENRPGQTNLSYGKRSRLVDHARSQGLEGLLTLIGVRYTTARHEAVGVIDRVFAKLGRRAPRSETHRTPLHGGRIESVAALRHEVLAAEGPGLGEAALAALVSNHGSDARQLLSLASGPLAGTLPGSHTLRAEVVHAVREEMAWNLADVVFRRTDLGTAGHPGEAALAECAELMAGELGWSPEARRKQLDEVQAQFPGNAGVCSEDLE